MHPAHLRSKTFWYGLAKLATKNIKNFRKSELHIETQTQTDKGDKVVGNHGINKNRNNSRDANNNMESNNRKDARNVGNTSRPKQLYGKTATAENLAVSGTSVKKQQK
jgi:hypothetical protein